ncbi:MAG TPA: glycosyltransferase [Planctomycetaceae bacterium]|nr:glycosyltransferase [Planctomycetaceae bacterium]
MSQIRGQKFVFFSLTEWSALPVSHIFLASLLKEHNEVVYVETTGNRAPRLTEAGRVLRRLARSATTGRRRVSGHLPSQGLSIRSPLTLPAPNLPGARAVNRLLMRRFCRRLRREGLEDAIAWVFAPRWVDAIDELRPRLVIFQSVDELTTYRGLDTPYARQQIDRMFRRADLVFIPGPALYEERRVLNPETFHIPNAADPALIEAISRPDTPLALELAGLPRPRLTYVGSLAPWIDFDLLADLAEARPHWSLVLVGPCPAVTPPRRLSRLRRLNNVHFAGEQPHARLPEFYRASDVLLLPFVVDRNRYYSDPTKIYEYLATGRPIVSTGIPSSRVWGDFIRVAERPADFLACCDAAAAEPAGDPLREVRRRTGAEQTWPRRLARMSEIISRKLASGPSPATLRTDPAHAAAARPAGVPQDSARAARQAGDTAT